MPSSGEQQNLSFNFPAAERKVFKRNFLDAVIIELRYPTYLRLKEKEPLDISEAIRDRYPRYELGQNVQMTPLGTTDPQPVYKFATKAKDLEISISISSLALTTNKYMSFENFSSHVAFLIERAIPHIDTTFFTRVGLRYINKVAGMHETGADIPEWINYDLVSPVARREVGTIISMNNELSGQLTGGAGYTFRYGLSPPSNEARRFVLDWDYFKEDVEVTDCMDLLKEFHDVHFPFFWWTLGVKAKEALINGTAST